MGLALPQGGSEKLCGCSDSQILYGFLWEPQKTTNTLSTPEIPLAPPIQELTSPELGLRVLQCLGKKDGRKALLLSHRQVPSGLALDGEEG